MYQANKANNKRDKIHTCILGLEYKLYISNNKREQTVSLFPKQTVNVKYYEKIIDILQNSISVKPDKVLLLIERLINKCSSIFTHVLSSLVNR